MAIKHLKQSKSYSPEISLQPRPGEVQLYGNSHWCDRVIYRGVVVIIGVCESLVIIRWGRIPLAPFGIEVNSTITTPFSTISLVSSHRPFHCLPCGALAGFAGHLVLHSTARCP